MLNNFTEIFEALRSRDSKKRMVAAWGVDSHTISAAAQAVDLGLVEVTLVGNQDMIAQVCIPGGTADQGRRRGFPHEGTLLN